MNRPARTPEARLVRRTGIRLGLQAAAIVSIIVVALTTTAVLVVLRSQRDGAATLLREALVRAIDVLDPPADVWLIMRSPAGAVGVTPGLPPALADRQDTDALERTTATGVAEEFDRRVGGDEYRVQTLHRADGWTLEGILDLRGNHAERDQLITAMLAAGGIGLLLAGGAGAWLGARATRPLSGALALQRRFVSDASHELRTPLTLLSTRAQLLRRRLRAADPAPEVLDAADRVVADAGRLAAILDDLLLAADPTATAPRADVDLAALAAEVVAGVEPPGQPEITLVAAEPVVVRGSSVALRRAVTALVDNAMRHGRRHVQVSVRAARHQAVLEVADDGPGIDPEVAPRLFQRFATTGARDPDGRRHYGIGLALVSEITASHGGRVELGGGADTAGAVLRLVLPLSASRPPGPNPARR